MVSSRIFVGGLSYHVRERDIERFFKSYGVIKEILLKKGYCFVEFDDYKDADDAVYELNGKELMGERVSVEKARGTPRGSDVWRGSGRPPRDYGPPPRRPSRGRDRDSDHRNNERYGPPSRTEHRLIVENLSSRVSWQDLKDYMRQAGEVTYADAHKQRKNEGVVEFASYSDLKTALERLDGTELNGRRVRLVEAKRHRRSSRSSSSRSRSRSRSRDRSKSRRSVSESSDRGRSRSTSRERNVKSLERGRSRSTSRERNGKSSDRGRSRSTSRGRNGKSDASGDEED